MQIETTAARLRRRFFGTLAAGAAALGLMTAAAAVPARAADRDDMAKALAAIAAVAIIAKIADDNRTGAKPAPVPTHGPGWGHGKPGHGGPGWDRDRDRRGVVLPRACAIDIGNRRNSHIVYGERCLRDHGLRRLPERCEFTVRLRGRPADVYAERCLTAAGFRAERGRR